MANELSPGYGNANEMMGGAPPMGSEGINYANHQIIRLLRFSSPFWLKPRIDETYIRVKGKYLYRAVDSKGRTIDF